MAGQQERKVSVVIPTWKRDDWLQKCLHSVDQQTFRDFSMVVVSNRASEQAVRMAEASGSSVIRLNSNRGFAAGVNAGIAQQQSRYVLVLNDDVELEPHWLQRTVALLDERLEFFYCCGKIYQDDGQDEKRDDGQLLDNAGDALSLGGSAWRLGFGRRDSAEFDLPRPVWAVSGTATLFRRTVFEKIGLFDEDYFAYLEDMDLSLRAARAGLRGCYLPDAVCRHGGGATLGGQDSAAVIRLMTQNQLLLLAKQFPKGLLLRLAPRILWAQMLWAALAIRKRRLGAYMAGLWGFLRLLPAAMRRRPAWRPENAQALLARLRTSEREIYADITAADRPQRDTFWKLYFGLFRPRGKPEAAERSLRTAP